MAVVLGLVAVGTEGTAVTLFFGVVILLDVVLTVGGGTVET